MGRKWALVSMMLAASLVAAACGSSSKGSTATSVPATTATSGTNGSPAASTAPANGTTLSIGTIETETGAAGQSGRVTVAIDILNAWVKATNAQGGILGHPVKLIALNDNDDPALAKSDLTELVQQDHVLAIVGDDAEGTEPTWGPYMLAHRTPVIGGNNYSTNSFTNPMFYAGMTTVLSQVWGQVDAAKLVEANPKLGSLLCSNLTVCQ